MLVNKFIEEFCDIYDIEEDITCTIEDDAMSYLMDYDYPGNVRELRNIVERISVLAPEPLIEPWHLPADFAGSTNGEDEQSSLKLADSVAAAEKACILKALRMADGKRTKTAEILGISRKNLWEKLKQHKLSP